MVTPMVPPNAESPLDLDAIEADLDAIEAHLAQLDGDAPDATAPDTADRAQP